MNRIPLNVDDLLKHSLPSASHEQTESASARVLRRLQSSTTASVSDDVMDFGPAPSYGWRWFATAAVAASIVILAIWIGVGSRNHGVFAVPAEGLLYRSTEGNADYYRAGERIKTGEVVHTNDYSSAAFTLPDGSRVEMRSKSELSIEDGKDGVRIHLSKGAIVVDAASSPTGSRLYVQTNSVTAAALKSGFLVHVERSGTRVGALWGVIRVEQGDRVTTLQPGEQTATTPGMSPVSLAEDIEWSRNSETYMDKLKQATGTPPALPPQNEPPPIERPQLPTNPIQRQPSEVVLAGQQDRRGGRGISPPAVDGTRPSQPAFEDKWAEGKRILDRSCSGCHTTDVVYLQILAGRKKQRYVSRSDYEELIAAENARGAGVTQSESVQLVDWLSNFVGGQ